LKRRRLRFETLETREVPSYVPSGYVLSGTQLLQGTTSGLVVIDNNVTFVAQAGNRVVDLHLDGTLTSRIIESVPTAPWSPVASGVSHEVQSWGGGGSPVPVFVSNNRFQQTNDGVNVSTIDLNGAVNALAEGRDAAGRQVLYVLRQDGMLYKDTATGVGALATGVTTLIQSWDGYGRSVPLFLANGRFQQTNDGVNIATIDLGGTIMALADGRNTAGQQVIYALRKDNVLLEDTSTGVRALASGVTTLIQSWDGYGRPLPLFLANGRFQQTNDGVNIATIDLRGTITQLARTGATPLGQIIYALRSDGVLFADTATGVKVYDVLVNSITVANGQLVVDDWFTRNLPDAAVRNFARQDLVGHGSLTRQDMIGAGGIIATVESDGALSANELASLRSLAAGGATLGEAPAVSNLLGKVANATGVGSASSLRTLVDKYFFGRVRPFTEWRTGPNGQTISVPYIAVAGSAFATGGPRYTDVMQQGLGVCTYMSALAEIAFRRPDLLTSAITDNGDNTWTIRFVNVNGQPTYVTVDNQLPAWNGQLIYANTAAGVLWPALFEKALAEVNEEGWLNSVARGAYSYQALNGGSPQTSSDTLQAITAYIGTAHFQGDDSGSVWNAWGAGRMVILGTGSTGIPGVLEHNHAYAVVGQDASGRLRLYNPWGMAGGTDTSGTFYPGYVLISRTGVDQYCSGWASAGEAADPVEGRRTESRSTASAWWQSFDANLTQFPAPATFSPGAARIVPWGLPSARSHKRTSPSHEPEARTLPSGERATL
jgi:hypothetical protein